MTTAVKAISSIFSPSVEKPDTSALEAQEREARLREAEDKRKVKANLVALRGGGGRFKLFADTGEQGVRETLG